MNGGASIIRGRYAVLVAAIGLVAVTYIFALYLAYLNVGEASDQRAGLLTVQIEGQLARYDYLPSLLEETPSVLHALDRPESLVARNAVSDMLRRLNALAGTVTLYILDAEGVSIAASDSGALGSSVGWNLSFRPYYRDAKDTGKGHFYGVGVASGVPGYYVSYGINVNGKRHGSAVAKVDLSALEREWRGLGIDVAVVDRRGVVILSSRNDWRYRPLVQLGDGALSEIAKELPYGDSILRPLGWKERLLVDGRHRVVSVDGNRYVATERELGATGWRLIVFEEDSVAHRIAFLRVSVLLLFLAFLIVLWQRSRANRAKLKSSVILKDAYASLEAKVQTRTQELLSANERLSFEIETRRRIEQDLRSAQADLVHAEQLAVIGKMSTAVAHELNQPLGALRTLSDNAMILLEQGCHEEVAANLRDLSSIVDRLGRVTKQLRRLGYKSRAAAESVELRTVVDAACFIMATSLRKHGVTLELSFPLESMVVLADRGRLELVFINLIANAIDAMKESPTRNLRLCGQVFSDHYEIAVEDTGKGIMPEMIDQLFRPFATSKPVGKGLGLGLFVSAQYLQDLNGNIEVKNLIRGGACFVVRLQRAEDVTESANPVTDVP